MNFVKEREIMASNTEIARALLRIKAVFLRPEEPFIWASGIKSPIYCDNRLILSYPEERNLVEDSIAEKVRTLFPECAVLMGTSTAERLALPMGYVRGSAKDHGRKNQIEGRIEPGQKTVVIEDLISTGGSVIECVDVLREAGADVLGIVSIFTYGMQKGLHRLEAANITNHSLCDLDTLARVAVQEKYINPEDETRLLRFRDNPSDESWLSKKEA